MLSRRGGAMGKSRAMRLSRNAREIVATTELPVSADLENCFGDEPEVAAETIRLAGETGLVGGWFDRGL